MNELDAYPSLLQELLIRRGIVTRDAALRFLEPDYERDLHDPYLILGMKKAVERIVRAVDERERIVIYADYDCDGIPGGVVLHDFFTKIGYEYFSVYIPHRYTEGYGLNTPAIERFAEEGVQLIITVDNGITDVAEVARAESLGMNVIVTDHHLPGVALPPAYVVLNSKQEGDTYPFPLLCGAGVAFKLAQALLATERFDVPPGWEKWLLDAVGISTVADMVPLEGENRALAHFGLKVLRRTRRPGLLQLFRRMRIDPRTITEEDIGFGIGPRINAASRLGIPLNGFKLLATRDISEAGALVEYLEEKNSLRKSLVGDMVASARRDVKTDDPVIVVGRAEWLPGVVGLVAGKLVEEFSRPAFVWGSNGAPHGKGSCRSDGAVNMVSLMQAADSGTFLDFGGHEASGGFSVSDDGATMLRERLVAAYLRVEKKQPPPSGAAADPDLSLEDVNGETFDLVSRLAPFGIGNPRPVFRFPRVVIENITIFGKLNNHARFAFKKHSGERVSAIKFFSSGEGHEAGDLIDLYAYLEKSYFGRVPELRLRVVDMRRA